MDCTLTPSQRSPCAEAWNGRYTSLRMLSCGPFSSFLRARPARSFPDITSHMSAEGSSAPPPATDEIIERCLNGDQSAWESIVRMYRRKVFNVAYKFVGRHDQAEDLTQDVFLKLYKSLDTFDRRANFQTWLISVSRNLCIYHYRAVRKERETINRDVDANELSPLSHDPGPVAALEQQDRVQLLREAMSALPETLRTAVLM